MSTLGSNKDTMKLENRRQVLGLIRQGPRSRAGLAKETGLSQAAIGNIVGDFLEAGILQEIQKEPEETLPGRRPILLDLVPEWKTAVGISIDREGFEVGLLDLRGNILGKTSVLPYCSQPQTALDTIAQTVQTLLDEQGISPESVLGVGAIAPGPVDAARGKILNPPRFEPWHGLALKEELGQRLHHPVYIEHNASAMARAELELGSPYRSFALILVNDGIGLGLALDGKIFTGSHGLGCELGHTSIDFQGRPCSCGNRGCLELYASTGAILYDARRVRPELTTWESLVDAAWNGDGFCDGLLELQAEYLAASVTNLNNLLELEAIILGGAAAYRGKLLLDKLKRQTEQRLLSKNTRSLSFQLSRAKDHPSVRAAGAVALHQLFYGELFPF